MEYNFGHSVLICSIVRRRFVKRRNEIFEIVALNMRCPVIHRFEHSKRSSLYLYSTETKATAGYPGAVDSGQCVGFR